MDEILKKYPAPSFKKQWIIPIHHRVDFVLDLHGFTKDESEKKLEWVKNNKTYKNWRSIRIVTGKGEGVLYNHIQKILKRGYFIKSKWKALENESGFDVFFL